MKAITHVVVDADDVGERADVVLARRVPELSRRVARALALRGRLHVDERPAPPSHRVALGQTLQLELGDTPADPPGAPRVLAVSDAFVYVDKPAGWHTHRLRPDDPPSLADAVARVHPECAAAAIDAREGGAIHRLDRETTGVVAFARSRAAWMAGRAAIPTAVKLYVAVGHGGVWPPAAADTRRTDPPVDWPAGVPRPAIVEAWSITAPLGRGSDPSRVRVRADGVAAHTIVVPIASDLTAAAPMRMAFVVDLRSGHRHQARVHLAHLGWPIVGDARYAPAQDGPLLLHCACIDLSARCPGEPRVEAEVPWAVPWAGPRAP